MICVIVDQCAFVFAIWPLFSVNLLFLKFPPNRDKLMSSDIFHSFFVNTYFGNRGVLKFIENGVAKREVWWNTILFDFRSM